MIPICNFVYTRVPAEEIPWEADDGIASWFGEPMVVGEIELEIVLAVDGLRVMAVKDWETLEISEVLGTVTSWVKVVPRNMGVWSCREAGENDVSDFPEVPCTSGEIVVEKAVAGANRIYIH